MNYENDIKSELKCMDMNKKNHIKFLYKKIIAT